MPRTLRVQYPRAIYHIMSRGDRREDIFFDDVDRQDFIKTLAEACAKTDFQVHAFCLTSNHFHLVLETPQANLAAGMQWLLSSYTLRLNRPARLERARLFNKGTIGLQSACVTGPTLFLRHLYCHGRSKVRWLQWQAREV